MEINREHKPEFSYVGKRVPRVDAVDKVTGFAKYVDGIELRGMLYGKILGSPHPHARIISIDTSKAEELPGVEAVITGKDIPYNKTMARVINDRSLLATEKVCYVGAPVAAVAAISEEIAEKALELIDVKYEVLPSVLDPEEAMRPETIRIYDEFERNIAAVRRVRIGDAEAGLKASDYVFEGTFKSNLVDQAPPDTDSTVAVFEPGGGLTVWATSNTPGLELALFSRCFGIPKDRIRVISLTMGGGYGGRSAGTHPARYITAALARKVGIGKPVKITDTREEEFICSNVQRDMIHHFTIGVMKDGKINALKDEAIYDCGAYADLAVLEAEYQRLTIGATYNIPNISWDSQIVYTNEPGSGALRGFGDQQLFFGLEQLMNEIADKLNMDHLEFRLKNIFRDGDYVPLLHRELHAFALDRCLERTAEAIGLKEKSIRWNVSDKRIRAIGIASGNHQAGWRAGFGSILWRTGVRSPEALYELQPNHPALVRLPDGKIEWRPGFEIVDKRIGKDVYDADPSSCIIKMNEDGTVILYLAETDYGQGYTTAMAIIAAEELGVKPEDITVFSGDTSLPVAGLGSYASRLTMIAGRAVQRAAIDLRNQLLAMAVKVFRELDRVVTPENLEVKERKIYIKGTDKFIWIADAAYRTYATREGGYLIAKGYYDPPSVLNDPETGEYCMATAFAPSAAAVEVEVNLETGQFNIDRVVVAYDTGKVISMLAAEGQAQGSIAQGIGFACTENLTIDKRGTVLNPNYLKDHLMTSQMMPKTELIFCETSDPEGPYGAKGFGEGSMIPVPAAIASALHNALNARIEELPITPEKIYRIIKEGKNKGRRL